MNKNIEIKKDYVKIYLKRDLYSKESIFAAGYVFLDKVYILLDQEKDNILVYLYPKKTNSNLKRLGFEFLNELLNYSHYFSRSKANAKSMQDIMQKALFSAAPSLAEEHQDKEIEALIKELEEEEKNEQKKDKRKGSGRKKK
jgi:His-Xaa-Ser system protein HxsD